MFLFKSILFLNVCLILFLFFKLEYNCFTMLCWFLLYNKVNQPYVNTHPLPLGFPSHPLPSSPSQVISEHRAELPVLYSGFPFTILHTVLLLFHGYNILNSPRALTGVYVIFNSLLCFNVLPLYPLGSVFPFNFHVTDFLHMTGEQVIFFC